MSTAIKWVIAVIVLVALVWLVWYSGWLGGSTQNPTSATQTSAVANATPQPPVNTNGMSSPNDTSDAAIAQDTAAVDAQVQGLTSDSSSVAASFTDKPVTQAY